MVVSNKIKGACNFSLCNGEILFLLREQKYVVYLLLSFYDIMVHYAALINRGRPNSKLAFSFFI